MNTRTFHALIAGAPLLLAPYAAVAQDSLFAWEGEIEIGNESVFDADDPSAEIRDTFATMELNGEAQIGDGVSIFGGFTVESIPDATMDRTFEDVGVYIHELGFRFALANTTFSLGKITPSFGVTWDAAAGYFGATLAEDYELTEMLGVTADVELAGAGVLSFGLFYADDSPLSRSAGFKRGRNTVAAGGAANTGKLNNATVEWSRAFGDTEVRLGARYLTAGVGGVDDETGSVASVGHDFGSGLALFGEVAAFDNFGGGADDATYVTLNGSYAVGSLTYSATYARRDLDTQGKTDLFSVGAEYELENGVTFGGALAFIDEAGVESQTLGVNVLIPFSF